MEEGVLNGLLQSDVGELFNATELIKDVSGAGNNWATGFHFYGSRYQDHIVDAIRKECELCDCLQSFFILHSMGGGTGSGLGSRTLSLIADNFPDVFRFVMPVYPSAEDDVITSPYNTTLAMKQISEYGNCVMPVENQSLTAICQKLGSAKVDNIKHTVSEGKEKAFNRMNSFVAKLILDITASARFDGSMNVDINEICMNLVPFPKANYLVPAIAPLYSPKVPQPRHVDAIFTDVFANSNQLCRVDLRKGTFLSCALLVRGNLQVSDVRRNVDRLSENTKFIYWNRDGWKTGLCSVPPIKQMYSILSLANNTSIKYTFEDLRSRFFKLFSRKAHLHHYLNVEGMCIDQVKSAHECLRDQIAFYDELDNAQPLHIARPTIY
jgi:tubulin epsilon